MDISFLDNILNRKSIRYFSDSKLDQHTLDTLLNCARQAPTSGMVQAWSVLIISDYKLREKLVADNPCIGNKDGDNVGMILKSSHFLVWLADQHRNKTLLEQSEYSIPPTKMDTAEMNLKAICDATIAAQTFSLAAESIGLGTCYMGTIREVGFDYWNTHFNVPKHAFPLFGMAIGYPSTTQRARSSNRERLPLDVMVHYDVYSSVNNVDIYNEAFKQPNSRFTSFEDQLNNRICGSSKHRDQVADSLQKAGFKFE